MIQQNYDASLTFTQRNLCQNQQRTHVNFKMPSLWIGSDLFQCPDSHGFLSCISEVLLFGGAWNSAVLIVQRDQLTVPSAQFAATRAAVAITPMGSGPLHKVICVLTMYCWGKSQTARSS